jgi:hypothetical protein
VWTMPSPAMPTNIVSTVCSYRTRPGHRAE